MKTYNESFPVQFYMLSADDKLSTSASTCHQTWTRFLHVSISPRTETF